MSSELNLCPGSLKAGYNGYSPRVVKDVFNGKTVSHNLELEDALKTHYLKIEKRKLQPADERGPLELVKGTDALNGDQLPANMHLTLQIAAQVFDIETVKNAMIFLNNGMPALVVRRIQQEGVRYIDFATLAGKEGEGNSPYQFSYAGMAELIDKHVPAAIAAKEKLFRQVVFNYLFSNGDAHLKKFGLVDTRGNGDWQMAPASGMYNTAIHGDTRDMALLDGLYLKDHEKLSYQHYGYYAYDDLYQFGMRIGIVSFRVKRFLDQLLGAEDQVKGLVSRSFLRDDLKQEYLRLYDDRHRRLSGSLSGLLKQG